MLIQAMLIYVDRVARHNSKPVWHRHSGLGSARALRAKMRVLIAKKARIRFDRGHQAIRTNRLISKAVLISQPDRHFFRRAMP